MEDNLKQISDINMELDELKARINNLERKLSLKYIKEKIENLLLNDKIDEAKSLIFNEMNKNKDLKESPELYSFLGIAYAMEGNNSLAIQYLDKAYQLSPDNSEIMMKTCNFLLANKKYKEVAKFVDNFYEKKYNDKQADDETDDTFNYLNFIVEGRDVLSYLPLEKEEPLKTTDKDVFKSNEFVEIANDSDNLLNYFDVLLKDNQSYIEIENNEEISIVDFSKESIDVIDFNNEVLGELPEIPLGIDKSELLESDRSTSLSYKENTENIETSYSQKPRLLFTTYGWNESGGGTTFSKEFIKELANRGYKVAVFYAAGNHQINTSPYFMEHIIEEGVELYGVFNRPAAFYDIDNPLREVKNDNIVKLFRQVIDEFSPDLINFHNFLGLSFEIANVAKELNFTTTYTPYNYHLIDPLLYMYDNDLVSWKNTNFFENSHLPKRFPMLIDGYKTREQAAKKLLSETIDYTFAVSRRVKEILSNFVGIEERISVINQVHNIEELSEKSNKDNSNIHFAFIGAVIPQKGVHIIAQAAQLLDYDNVKFDIYGFSTPEYLEAIKSIDKTNKVILHGEYSKEDFLKIAQQSDMAIMPSIWEDCAPFVLTECLAMKLPVIASNIGGARDFIIEGYNGTFFEPGNAKALAAVIQSLIENSFKIANMRKNCKLTLAFQDYFEHKIKIYDRLFKREKPLPSELELYFHK